MINIYIIGCGGVGGFLTERLLECIASLSLDLLEEQRVDIQKYLNGAGTIAFPSVVDSITLVDGDTFNPRNAMRQGRGAGGKLQSRLRAMNDSFVHKGMMQSVRLRGFANYATPDNIMRIIPMQPPANGENTDFIRLYSYMKQVDADSVTRLNASVVFLCVDNSKSIYEVSEYMSRFDNCLVLHGGNDKTTGSVTVYERHCGKALDPMLKDRYENIRPDIDKRPDEEECGVIAPKHDQIAIVNSLIADVMLGLFVKWARCGLGYTKGNGKRQLRHNEVLIDINTFSMRSGYYQLSENKENENPVQDPV